MEGLLRYWIGGLIFGGANTWRGLFLEFYGILSVSLLIKTLNGCSPLPGIHLLLFNFLQLFLKKIDCILY